MSSPSIKVALSVYRDAKKGHDMQFVVRQGTLWLVRRPKKGAIGNSSSEKRGQFDIRRPKGRLFFGQFVVRKGRGGLGSLSSEERT